MKWSVMALWSACVVSALGVVYSSFEARRATQTLESLRKETNELRVSAGKYQLEKSSWSSYGRVEQMAERELRMSQPDDDNTIVVVKH